MESPESCAHSCFYLALNGTRLNDFAELGEIEGMTPETELQLVEGNTTQICGGGDGFSRMDRGDK